ncbi:MAG: cytochrome c oxidase subunit 3 [Planctomycetota bacterium]|jgi:cytochrome c oxidase subunit 3
MNERHRTPFDDPHQRFQAGRFGMALFLASLAMLFAASVISFIVIRLSADDWPQELPPLPATLWASTLLLIASSVTMQWALVAARSESPPALRLGLGLTLTLVAAFLVLQGISWWEWLVALRGSPVPADSMRYALSGFYVLTGVHAAHVIGGLVPMVIVTSRAWRGRYSSRRYSGVQYCTMYWHFLDGVWLALFLTLLAGV